MGDGSSPKHSYACRGQDFLSSPCPVATSGLLRQHLLRNSYLHISVTNCHMEVTFPMESPDLWVEQISCCRFTFNAKIILSSSDFFCHSLRDGRVNLYFLTRRFRGTESVCFQITECKTPLTSCWIPCPCLLVVFSRKSREKCWWLFQILSALMFQRAGSYSCVGGPVLRTLSLSQESQCLLHLVWFSIGRERRH